MQPFRSATLLLTLGVLTGGCNAITGADEFVVDVSGAGGNKASSGVSNPSSGSNPGQGGASAANGTGAGGGVPIGPVSDATGVSIREIAFYQAVKSTVMKTGKGQTPSVSLIGGRPAVVRVFVDVGQTSGAPISARLTFGSGPLRKAPHPRGDR